MDKIELNNISDFSSIANLIKNNEIDLEISYLSDFRNTKKLRDIINDICNYLNIGTKDIYKIILIIDEMNNNAIEYGSKAGDVNKIRFKTTNKNANLDLIIEVEDSGKGTKAKNASSMEKLKVEKLKNGYLKYHSIRGRGLFLIIINLVDNLYFKNSDSGGLIVGIQKVLEN